MSDDKPGLTPLQMTVLELESMTWRLPGSKYSAFRRRHPHVTPTGYDHCLWMLTSNSVALAYDNGRYAPMLRRVREKVSQRARQSKRLVDPTQE